MRFIVCSFSHCRVSTDSYIFVSAYVIIVSRPFIVTEWSDSIAERVTMMFCKSRRVPPMIRSKELIGSSRWNTILIRTRETKRLTKSLLKLTMVSSFYSIFLIIMWSAVFSYSFHYPFIWLLFSFLIFRFGSSLHKFISHYQLTKCFRIVKRGMYTIGMVKKVSNSMLPVVAGEVVAWIYKTYLARKFSFFSILYT